MTASNLGGVILISSPLLQSMPNAAGELTAGRVTRVEDAVAPLSGGRPVRIDHDRTDRNRAADIGSPPSAPTVMEVRCSRSPPSGDSIHRACDMRSMCHLTV